MTNSDYGFQGAMRIECEECGEQAQMHRLTNAGVFYCLKIRDSPSLYKFMRYEVVTPENERRVAMKVTVRDLVRAKLPKGLGKALQRALTTQVDEYGI